MSFVCIYISKDLNYPVALEIEQRTRWSYVADLWQSDECSTPHDSKSQPSVVWWNGAPRKGLRLINSYYLFHWFWDSYLYRLSLKSQTARTMVIALIYYSPFRFLPFQVTSLHIAICSIYILHCICCKFARLCWQACRPTVVSWPDPGDFPNFPQQQGHKPSCRWPDFGRRLSPTVLFSHIFTDLPFKHLDQLQIEDILYPSAQGHLAVRSKFHIKTAPAQLPSYFPSWFSALATWQTPMDFYKSGCAMPFCSKI